MHLTKQKEAASRNHHTGSLIRTVYMHACEEIFKPSWQSLLHPLNITPKTPTYISKCTVR